MGASLRLRPPRVNRTIVDLLQPDGFLGPATAARRTTEPGLTGRGAAGTRDICVQGGKEKDAS
jgi:hypothetical protein